MATVFPGVPGGATSADTPTLLIRLRPDQSVEARKGQADFGWGDYVRVLQDLHPRRLPGVAVRAADQPPALPVPPIAVRRLQDARPVFGPATRALPKLPLGIEVVDGMQYFVAPARL